MPFGNISIFYLPTTANAGSSLWGSDVRKLLSAADAGNDTTTKTNHGTSTSQVNRTVDPYTTSATDTTDSDYGWAIDPSDMNSVSGAQRMFPAGLHVITVRTASNASMLSAQATFTLYIYKVGASPTFTRTLIASAAGTTFNYGAVANVYRTEFVSVSCPEILFGVGETIQYSVELSCAGVTVSGRINTIDAGTQGGVTINVETPILRTVALADGSSAGSATVAGVTGKILNTVGASSGTGTASGVGGLTASTTGTSAGVATVSGAGSQVASTVGTSAGSATVTGNSGKILATVGTVAVGSGGGGTTYVEVDMGSKYGCVLSMSETDKDRSQAFSLRCLPSVLDASGVPQAPSATSPTPTMNIAPTAYYYRYEVDATPTLIGTEVGGDVSGVNDEYVFSLSQIHASGRNHDYTILVVYKMDNVLVRQEHAFHYQRSPRSETLNDSYLVIVAEPQGVEGTKWAPGVGLKIKAWVENNGFVVPMREAGIFFRRIPKGGFNVEYLYFESFFGVGNNATWKAGQDEFADPTTMAMTIDPLNENVAVFELEPHHTQSFNHEVTIGVYALEKIGDDTQSMGTEKLYRGSILIKP